MLFPMLFVHFTAQESWKMHKLHGKSLVHRVYPISLACLDEGKMSLGEINGARYLFRTGSCIEQVNYTSKLQGWISAVCLLLLTGCSCLVEVHVRAGWTVHAYPLFHSIYMIV